MRTEIDLNESEIDLNECEYFLKGKANMVRSKLEWESVHTRLDRSQVESQFAFKRSHLDRFWLRTTSDWSNFYVDGPLISLTPI